MANPTYKLIVFLFVCLAATVNAQPVITSFSPGLGNPGTSVTLTGTGFNSVTTNNIVYFGATRATVSAASATSLTVSVPGGATYAPISVNNTATTLTGCSRRAFMPTFTAGSYLPSLNFGTRAAFDIGGGEDPSETVICDIDGDGKPDLATTHAGSSFVSVHRNISSVGSLTTASLAAPVSFMMVSTPGSIVFADVDGDSKPDMITLGTDISIRRNISTPGSITTGSFGAEIDFAIGSGDAQDLAVADIDGDGKLDILFSSDYGYFSVLRNTASSGSITTGSFATPVSFSVGAGAYYGISVGDMDGDGMPDVAVTGFEYVSVFRNTASSGSITTGSFSSPASFTTGSGTWPKCIALGDIDGDGKADIVTGNDYDSVMSVFRNTATSGSITSGSFAAKVDFTTRLNPRSISLSDMNGDGKADIVVASESTSDTDKISVFINTASSGAITSGSLAAKVNVTPYYNLYSATVGDLDGDGRPDIVAVDFDNDIIALVQNCIPPPMITTASTLFGIPGSSLTLTGSNFSTVIDSNVVYFGATRATVSAASGTSLTVSVPLSATYEPISVTNKSLNLTGSTKQRFRPLFDTTALRIDTFVYNSKVNFTANANQSGIAFGDIDGDGKPEMITCNNNKVSVYRNTSTSGSIVTGSFAAKVDFTISAGGSKVFVADIDNDGKNDIITGGPTTDIYIFRNTATSGVINSSSFATVFTYGGGYVDGLCDVGDLDLDGKADIVATSGGSGHAPVILRNTAVRGVINSNSFGYPERLGDGFPSDNANDARIRDIDGDGKPDIVVSYEMGYSFQVYRNITERGSILGAWSDIFPYPSGPNQSFATPVLFTANTAYGIGLIEIGDVDGDGKQDIIVYSKLSGATGFGVLRNISTPGSITTGSFASKVHFTTSGGIGYPILKLADVNGDTKPDLLATDYSANIVTIFRNTASSGSVNTGSFAAGLNFSIADPAYGLAVCDIDGDTKPDVAAACGDSISVLMNLPITYIVSPITGTTFSGGVYTVCATASTALSSATPGGIWTSSVPTVGSVGSASGVVTGVSAGTTTVTFTVPGSGFTTAVVSVSPLPSPGTISGASSVCVGSTVTLTDGVSGGTWSSSAITVGTVGSTTGVVSGITVGTTTISYTVTNGCGSASALKSMTVNVAPSTAGTITAPAFGCWGTPMTFTNPVAGGTWTTSSGSVAVTGTTCVVSGMLVGTVTVSYTVTNGCGSTSTSTTVSVYSSILPLSPIVGANSVCVGSTTSLTTMTVGGTWSSSSTSVGTVSSSGVVTGITSGTTTISYTYGNPCVTSVNTFNVTVQVSPSAGSIVGSSSVCVGSTITLADGTAGGVWSSSSSAVASIGSTSGMVLGVGVGTTTISYTVTNSCGSASATAVVTVNDVPGSAGTISGAASICVGSTATFTSSVLGGTWSSSSNTIASVGSVIGVVSGVAVGTATITYTVTNSCGAAVSTMNVTVITLPDAGTVTGSASVCIGSTIAMTNAVTGGTWLSTNVGVASITASGVVLGVGLGTTTISYSVTNSCGTSAATKTVSVTATAVAGTITGSLAVCIGTPSGLSSTVTGGTWSSSVLSVATIGSASGILSGASSGTTTITYTINSSCGVVSTTAVATVNVVPAVIGGSLSVCVGATTNLTNSTGDGTWSVAATSIAGIGSASGVVTGGSAGTTTVTYARAGCITTAVLSVNPLPATPAAISGGSVVCVGSTITLANSVSGGIWSSSIGSVASVGSTTGLVSGVTSGTATISYTFSNGCGSLSATTNVTVGAAPSSAGTILGLSTVCVGSDILLTDGVSGGVWSSSNTSIATVGSLTGIVSGASAGTVTISYSVSNSCGTTVTTNVITVTPMPSAIGGPLSVCELGTTTLTNSVPGGIWSVAATSVATIGTSTGTVTGGSFGITTVTYGIGSCYTTAVLSVNPLPAPITGPSTVCNGSTITLSTITVGGTWSCGAITVATIGSLSGIVVPIFEGPATISFITTVGCSRSVTITVNPLPPVILGTSSMCMGEIATMTNSITGGAWGSSNTGVAAIGSSSGIVSTVSAGTVLISYTLPAGCTRVKDLTVNALPGTFGGATSVCVASNTTLTCTTLGGIWNSSNTAVATIDGTTGNVTGEGAGTTTISYTLPTGCTRTLIFTVNPIPATIGGSLAICSGASTTLTNSTSGGMWSSSATSIASIGSTSGLLTSAASGTSVISYTLSSTGCVRAAVMTINTTPASIGGATSICIGGSVTLSNTTSGGTWSSGNISVATVGSSTGIANGLVSGTSAITYTLPTGCRRTIGLTVNALPVVVGTSPSVCVDLTALATYTYSIPGGTWSSANTAIATVGITSGNVTGVAAGTATLYYTTSMGCTTQKIATVNPNPLPISGLMSGCPGSLATLSTATAGGIWTSGNTSVATIGPSTGIVTAVSAGTSIITYAFPSTGCHITTTATVNPLPAAITGTFNLCVGGTRTLTSGSTGGVWQTSNLLIATVDNITGIVTGVSPGTVTITYLLPTSCFRTQIITVNPLPSPITGTTTICLGASSSLFSASGGTWSSSTPSVASVVSLTGVVSGASAGTTQITYTLPTGCYLTTNVTILPLPAAITGPTSVCVGSGVTLACSTTGGTWSSSNPSVATISSTSGVVTGVTGGVTTITYTLSTGCFTTITPTVNPLPVAGTLSGPTIVCVGATISVAPSVSGGTWGTTTGKASVSTSGIVTGITDGLDTVRYTVTNVCGTAVASYPVVVNALPVAGTISGSDGVCLGLTTLLTASVTGGSWTSSNTAIGTVSSTGVVTGVALGMVTISYSVSNTCGTVYTTKLMTINALADAGTISGADTICQDDISILTNSITGGTWISSNAAVATVTSSGAVTGVGPGTVVVLYIVSNICNVDTAIHPITVKSATECTSSIHPPATVLSAGIKMYPNPNKGLLNVESEIEGSLSVYTIDGREVMVYPIKVGVAHIALSRNLAEGLYMCRFSGNDGQLVMMKLVYNP